MADLKPLHLVAIGLLVLGAGIVLPGTLPAWLTQWVGGGAVAAGAGWFLVDELM